MQIASFQNQEVKLVKFEHALGLTSLSLIVCIVCSSATCVVRKWSPIFPDLCLIHNLINPLGVIDNNSTSMLELGLRSDSGWKIVKQPCKSI